MYVYVYVQYYCVLWCSWRWLWSCGVILCGLIYCVHLCGVWIVVCVVFDSISDLVCNFKVLFEVWLTLCFWVCLCMCVSVNIMWCMCMKPPFIVAVSGVDGVIWCDLIRSSTLWYCVIIYGKMVVMVVIMVVWCIVVWLCMWCLCYLVCIIVIVCVMFVLLGLYNVCVYIVYVCMDIVCMSVCWCMRCSAVWCGVSRWCMMHVVVDGNSHDNVLVLVV
jgi:hypothetical protein